MSDDLWIGQHAHPHTFPNGNVHRHVHPRDRRHPDDWRLAHPDPADLSIPCVDCEPHRAQQAVLRKAAR